MKSDAFDFARRVDRLIEECPDADYLQSKGRAKRLRQELYPISRLGLRRKQPGLEVIVEAFEDNGPVDGHIIERGFRDYEFDVEVTAHYGYEEALRSELLVSRGSAPGAGSIWRDRTLSVAGERGKIVAEQAAIDQDFHITRIAKAVVELFRAKAAKSYGASTFLIIAFDEIRHQGRGYWDALFAEIEREGGIRVSPFEKVLPFNGATGELRDAR